MVRSVRSCSTVVFPFAAASALLIGAIYTRTFWLSMALGIGGLGILALGALGFRRASKGLTDNREL